MVVKHDPSDAKHVTNPALFFLDAVVVDAAVVSHRNRALSRATFAVPHQKGTVDAAAQQVFGGVSTDAAAVVPRVLVQGARAGQMRRRQVAGVSRGAWIGWAARVVRG